MDKPIYVGTCVLDYSKHLMYDFILIICKKYGSKSKLLSTDTDSLCYSIRTEDFSDDIRNDILEFYDISFFNEELLKNIMLTLKAKG